LPTILYSQQAVYAPEHVKQTYTKTNMGAVARNESLPCYHFNILPIWNMA